MTRDTQGRRIAVMQLPRPANRRLGNLGVIRPAPVFFSVPTLSNEQPTTAAMWLASKIEQQAAARDTTPGTLSYAAIQKPLPSVISRWNSWAGPCGSGTVAPEPTPAPAPIGLTDQGRPAWLLIAAGLGAAASAVYLLSSLGSRRF